MTEQANPNRGPMNTIQMRASGRNTGSQGRKVYEEWTC